MDDPEHPGFAHQPLGPVVNCSYKTTGVVKSKQAEINSIINRVI